MNLNEKLFCLSMLASSLSLNLLYFNGTGLFSSFDTNWSLNNFSKSAFFCNSCLSSSVQGYHIPYHVVRFLKSLCLCFYLGRETCLTYPSDFLLIETGFPSCLRNFPVHCKIHIRENGSILHGLRISYWNNRKVSQASAVLIMMLTVPT